MTSTAADETHPLWKDRPTSPVQIVLEGGSFRGLFTCGVLDFFLDRGLLAESVVGVSAGALCGYSYVAGAAGQTARINIQYRHDWRFASLRSYFTTGNLIGTEFFCKTIPHDIEHLDPADFADSPMRLTTVATDLETAEPVYHLHERGEDPKTTTRYLMAGSALPYISRPVELDGRLLMDGGASDRVPYLRGQRDYRGRQIVILTHSTGFVQPRTYDAVAAPLFYGRYPAFVRRLIDRPAVYVRTLDEIEAARERGDLFVIRPREELDIGTVEKDTGKLFEGYVAGLEEAARQWDALREYLSLES